MKFLLIVMLFISSISLAMDRQSEGTKQPWNGSYYKNNSEPQFQAAVSYLQKLDLKKFPRILDLGCGAGLITQYIAQQAPESFIIGVDPAESMIKEARVLCASYPRVSFQQARAEDFVLTQKVDVAVSFAMLHWIEEQKKALEQVNRNLHKDGQLHLVMQAKLSFDHPQSRALKEIKESEKWKVHFEKFKDEAPYYPQDKETLISLLDQAGFRDIEVKEIPRIRTFQDLSQLKAWIHGFVSAINGVGELSKEKKEEFVDDMLAQYSEISGQSLTGPITSESKTLAAKAIKK